MQSNAIIPRGSFLQHLTLPPLAHLLHIGVTWCPTLRLNVLYHYYVMTTCKASYLAAAVVDWFRNGPSSIPYDTVVYHSPFLQNQEDEEMELGSEQK